MTERQCKQLLREDILPVILGNSISAHRLSISIHAKYGLCSLLCAPRSRFLDLINPFAFFLPLMTDTHPRLIREQLSDLSMRYENTLLLLIPSTQEELSRLGKETDALEENFLLVRSPDRLKTILAPCLR